jgi:kinetochore protein Spc25
VEVETNQCKLNEIDLLAGMFHLLLRCSLNDALDIDLDKEQEERKTSELFVATLKRQLTSIREKCIAFDVEIDQYQAIKVTLLRGWRL